MRTRWNDSDIGARWWLGGGGEPANRNNMRARLRKSSRPRDGELGRPVNPEADGLPVARGVQAEAPGLDVDAMVPEAGLGRGNADFSGADDVEVGKFVIGRGLKATSTRWPLTVMAKK